MKDAVQGGAPDAGETAGPSGVARFAINPGTSRLLVKTFAGGPLSALGHDLTFAVPLTKGEIGFDAEQLTGFVRVHIRADAIALQGGRSESDRRDIERTMKEKVLDVAQYGEIAYDSTDVRVTQGSGGYDVEVTGSLTLRGVTRPRALKARVTLMGGMLRAFGEFTLRMSEHGIEQVTVAGGVLKVKDEVKATFDVVARA